MKKSMHSFVRYAEKTVTGCVSVIMTLLLLQGGYVNAACNSPNDDAYPLQVTLISSPASLCPGGTGEWKFNVKTHANASAGTIVLSGNGITGSPSGVIPAGAGGGVTVTIPATATTTLSAAVGDKTVKIDASIHADDPPQGLCENIFTNTFTVIKLNSVNANKPHCWDGKQITFTAAASPSGAPFPSGLPAWTATAGSFVGGNTGSSVVWEAPLGSGGTATITATSCSSSIDETVTYVDVSLPTPRGSLLRKATDSFVATVVPSGYPVSLSDSSTPGELDLSISGLAVAYENLIEETDVVAHADNVVAKIEASLSGCAGDILGIDYDLEKSFSDWYDNVTLFDGQTIYNVLTDFVVDESGDQIEAAALAYGFNDILSESLRSVSEANIETWMLLADPFPGDVTDSVIDESTTFAWSMSAGITTGAGTTTIKTSGFPGWPELSPPSPSEWLTGVNSHGFSSELFTVTGGTGTLTVGAGSATWNASGALLLEAEDSWGTWSLTGGFFLWMGF